MYLDKNGNVIKDMSTLGYKAIAVPGSVAGLAYAQQHWGKLTLQQVMEPAIRLAREGFVLDYGDARWTCATPTWPSFPSRGASFSATATSTSRATCSSSRSWRRRWSASPKNPDDFYHGELARELAAAMQKGGGLITAEDLAAYEVKERQPIRGTYRGYEVISAPPPSSGGVALVEILNILEGYDLAKQGNRSAASIHLTPRPFSARSSIAPSSWAIPISAKIPVAQLIDKRYGEAWRETIPLRRATPSRRLEASRGVHPARPLRQRASAAEVGSRA